MGINFPIINVYVWTSEELKMETDLNKLIIVSEDSPEDFDAMLRVFKKANMKNKVSHLEMGDDWMAYLFGWGNYVGEKSELSRLILLDLNLPGLDGRDVIKILKSTSEFKMIPVVVLTTFPRTFAIPKIAGWSRESKSKALHLRIVAIQRSAY